MRFMTSLPRMETHAYARFLYARSRSEGSMVARGGMELPTPRIFSPRLYQLTAPRLLNLASGIKYLNLRLRWRRIGRRFGPFDVTLIEAGQYDADWPDWHLGPELAVEAHRLVRGKQMIPVHWGLLKQAHHGWTEPVERVLAAAKCRNVDVLVPRPGESIEPTRPSSRVRWWPEIPWHSAHETPIVATRDGVASNRFEALPCGPSSSSAPPQILSLQPVAYVGVWPRMGYS